MRFRKYIKLGKGIKLNLSKSGISTTIGGKGLSLNVGKKGAFVNTGIPGTGLYNRKKITLASGKSITIPKNISAYEEWTDKSIGQKIFIVFIGTIGLLMGLLFLMISLAPDSPKIFLVAGLFVTPLSIYMFYLLWRNRRIKMILEAIALENAEKEQTPVN